MDRRRKSVSRVISETPANWIIRPIFESIRSGCGYDGQTAWATGAGKGKMRVVGGKPTFQFYYILITRVYKFFSRVFSSCPSGRPDLAPISRHLSAATPLAAR